MAFSWIKNLFSKKQKFLTSMDNAIPIPDFKDLSPEEQEIALACINEIDPNDYESIVKYNEDIDKKTGKYLDIMEKISKELYEAYAVLNKYSKRKDIDFNFKCITARAVVRISVLEKESELIKSEIIRLENLAKFKATVFKEFARRELKKNHKVFTPFIKAERMAEESRKMTFENSFETMMDSIRKIILNKYTAHAFSETSRDNALIQKFVDILDGDTHFGYSRGDSNFAHAIEDEYYDLNELYDNFGAEVIRKLNISHDEFCNNGYVGYKSDNYNSFVETLGLYKLELDICIYAHRLDYLNIIEDIKKANEHYESTPAHLWNTRSLKYDFKRFDGIVYNYLVACKKYLNEGQIKAVRDTLFELAFKWYCLEVENRWGIRAGKNFKNPELPIRFKEKEIEILKKIQEKNHIPEYDFDRIINKLQKYIEHDKDLAGKEIRIPLYYFGGKSSRLLVDALHEDFGESKEFINSISYDRNGPYHEGPTDYSSINDNIIYYKLYDFVINLNDAYPKKKWCLGYSNYVRIKEFYYALRCIGFDDSFIFREIFKNKYKSHSGISNDLSELIVKTQLSKCRKEFDNRIMIIPSGLTIDGNEETFFLKNRINKYQRTYPDAIYVESSRQLKNLKDYVNTYSYIKYVFVTEQAMNDFKFECRNDINGLNLINGMVYPRVIIVPNNTEYSELSPMLDKWIRDEKDHTLGLYA